MPAARRLVSDAEIKSDKRPRRDWEAAVEKQIREAIERGEFDHLPGKGKPLDLGEDPFTPTEWQLAFKILKDAGAAPGWIEQDKEIRLERVALEAVLQQQARWQRERAAKVKTLTPDRMIAERASLARAREEAVTRYRKRATALNKLIDTFNLKAPNGRLHHARVQIEREIKKFQDACDE